jgi:hypothetical protein
VTGGSNTIGMRILRVLAQRWRGEVRCEARPRGKSCAIVGTLPAP